ncbi:protein kinase domain-containing protein [Limnoglobus roseus]|uniref:Serine/threonine-protein kinase PknB n=1 Tax=Limnoglobus roseus TaxID=2598579 RepID=A0A5C1AFV2_9BACT|nr:HDOD domain-containing protein [Limnoglobus roseus]QEL16024.1 serine/threonine-protein kinase PknB [Limnoglobus roseus]
MDRNTLLASLLQQSKLVTPSPIALRVVKVTSNPDCTTSEIAELLAQDPVLCGKVLKTVNSCVFAGRLEPIASVERAIIMLGLNPLRSLVLGLSLPVAQTKNQTNSSLREFWVDGVSGGILAKELASLQERSSPGYDLVAGLLRDLGLLLLVQNDPKAWEEIQRNRMDEWVENPCAIEERYFGIDHVSVTAALLSSWKLPEDVVEPIRFHHNPQGLAAARKSLYGRAEMLNFVESLVRLDRVAESPRLLKALLAKARSLFDMGQEELIKFLEKISPKIQEIKDIFELDLGSANDYSAILSHGCEALLDLSLRGQFAQSSVGGGQAVAAKTMAADPRQTIDHSAGQTHASHTATTDTPPPAGHRLPAFKLEYLEELPVEGCRFDQFELCKELGRGAMGIVYSGFDPKVEREVAIKVLAPQFASLAEARQRFMREARAMAAVHHPNIIGVYTVGTVERLPYIVMEYVHGASLEDLIDQKGPLPIPQIVAFGCQMAAGLAAAHEKGIIHRDIKPANIMVDTRDGQAKIADFGLAHGIDDLQLTQAGTLIGSPLFMSPEQIEGLPTDERSDLFSLGGVLFNMCTGAMPFQGKTIAALVRLIGEVDPAPPRTFRPDLPVWLDALVMDLLKKNLRERVPRADMVYSRLVKYR